MPIYEYQCGKCQKDFEHLAKSMSQSDAAVPCPTCGSKKTSRKFSVFAVAATGRPTAARTAPSGHQHSGTCGCGRPHGSCPMM